jgi:hypothetical protein
VVAHCLRQRGWDATTDSTGWRVSGIPADQESQYFRDVSECEELAGPYDTLPPLTEEQSSAYFDSLHEVAECVRERGYTFAEAPSRRAAIEAIMALRIDFDDWEWPYGRLRVGETTDSVSELNQLYADCPQPPWPA